MGHHDPVPPMSFCRFLWPVWTFSDVEAQFNVDFAGGTAR
jgi:hypothetical protein